MKTIYFDTSQPIFNMKFKYELSKRLTWTKSELVQFLYFSSHFIECPWKPSILIYHNHIQIEILKRALKTAHLNQKWARTIFSTSDPILLVVHENDLFWYITTIFNMKFLKWAPKSAQSSYNELKMSRYHFPSFRPHFIHSAVKLSILMCHTMDFLWNF